MIQLADPNITADDIAAVVRVLQSGMLVQGKEVAALESEFAEYLNVPFAVAVSNGTATLHLALLALGIGAGDEVIVPSFSYIATANAVELVGAIPVFVDIDPLTFNLTPQGVAGAITPRTRAVMPVHEFGLPCDLLEIGKLCREKSLFLVEDAACALGSSDRGKMAGTEGDFGSFSLHPRKAITSGEGGILVTRDPELAARVRILRNHGIQSDDGRVEFVAAGLNYRLTDIQAALVRGQLGRLPAALDRRREIAFALQAGITNPLFALPITPAGKEVNWQTFHLVVDPAIERDEVIAILRDAGIGSNYGAQCMPAQKFLLSKYGHDCELRFPNGLAAWTRGLAIPAHEKLSDADVNHIIKTLNSIKQLS
jgi:perosamine synthetase